MEPKDDSSCTHLEFIPLELEGGGEAVVLYAETLSEVVDPPFDVDVKDKLE